MTPKKMINYSKKLALRIKSSLPNPKQGLALVLSIWNAFEEDNIASITYSEEDGSTTIPTRDIVNKLSKYFSIDEEDIKRVLKDNPLFTAQIEHISMAFFTIWRLADFKFVDTAKNVTAERTGMTRFSKQIYYTKNIDILNLFSKTFSHTKSILWKWLKNEDVSEDEKNDEANIIKILTTFSEDCIYLIRKDSNEIYFRNYELYKSLLGAPDTGIDIKDEKEQVGPARILPNIIKSNLNFYLSDNGNKVYAIGEELNNYSERVKIYLSHPSLNMGENYNYSESETDNISTEESNNAHTKNGENILYYGVPGVGKSFKIEKDLKEQNIPETQKERITFHPDYSYGEFIGQLLPKKNGDSISYEFEPGAFTRILGKALKDPGTQYYFIIEEINRGNASAIFGDIFQLLDRNDFGVSKYKIQNKDIMDFLQKDAEIKDEIKDGIFIPSNLTIYATMNTCDQNVFVLDTAFKRRWIYRYVKNPKCEYGEILVPGSSITWQDFLDTINKKICEAAKDSAIDEDKQLGAYFISKALLTDKENFADKVLMYLWSDVVRFDKSILFSENLNSFNSLRTEYMNCTPENFTNLFAKGVFV